MKTTEIKNGSEINRLHEEFKECGKNAKLWKRKCCLLLPEIDKNLVWHTKGFSSIYEYAAKLAALSRWDVNESLRVFRKIEDKPALKQVATEKGIHAVRAVVNIATQDTDEYWAKKADSMSKNELEMFVREVKNFNEDRSQYDGSTQDAIKFNEDCLKKEQFKTVIMQLKSEVLAKLEKLKNTDWNQLMEKFLEMHEENLENNKPQKVQNANRYVPRKIKNHVLKRSSGRCEFPNCNKQYKHLHHTERFSINKSHDPDKIIALCKSHHGIAHQGLINNENMQTRFWHIATEVNPVNPHGFIDEKVQFHRRI